MQVSVSEAKAQLTDLVRRAEAGDDVVLTRHGKAAVRLVPIAAKPTRAEREALVREVQAMARAARAGLPPVDIKAAQDELYDERGLPA